MSQHDFQLYHAHLNQHLKSKLQTLQRIHTNRDELIQSLVQAFGRKGWIEFVLRVKHYNPSVPQIVFFVFGHDIW